jgi:DNA repair protein RecN (Recombination protein N)
MLLELSIKDFAIIDTLHLRLHRMFNVFTGETGAGKSIIIDAVNALLGGKIGAEFVRAGCERATIEGIFSIEALPSFPEAWQPFDAGTNGNIPFELTTNGAADLFEAADITVAENLEQLRDASNSADARIALAALLREYDIVPEDGQLILSRDILRSGRSTARINGRTFTQQILQQVASWLVDIHGQSEHMSLLRPEQHVNFLDRYAELAPLRSQLAAKVSEWRAARKKLQSLQRDEREQARRAEFLKFEIDEIEKAELEVGEIEELEQERKVLSNAVRLHELCAIVYGLIEGSDIGSDEYKPALDQLREAQHGMSELTRLDKDLQEYEESLAEAIYRLEDVAASISSYEANIEDDPRRLEEVGDRLALISRLKRKYGATIEEILQHVEEDRAELDSIVHRDEIIAALQQQNDLLRREIGQLAGQMSVRRREAAGHLAEAMEEQLNDLNMKRARFAVEIEQEPDGEGVPVRIDGQAEQYYACDLTGIDRVQFLIAPNPGEPFKPLTKIASGGETSRLMLALKTILSAADATPTLIFDEIDAGISGKSGQIVGEKLWMLTQNHQVICVTHLPQIAAFADTHYNVSKQIFDDRTSTIVTQMRPEQRVRELAHIMGGTVTEFSMKSAEEMLARSYLWKEHWARALQKKAIAGSEMNGSSA